MVWAKVSPQDLITHLIFIIFFVTTIISFFPKKNKKYTMKDMYSSPLFVSWIFHATIFWGYIAFSKVIHRYQGPSINVTIWSEVIYLQMAISILGAFLYDKYKKG